MTRGRVSLRVTPPRGVWIGGVGVPPSSVCRSVWSRHRSCRRPQDPVGPVGSSCEPNGVQATCTCWHLLIFTFFEPKNSIPGLPSEKKNIHLWFAGQNETTCRVLLTCFLKSSFPQQLVLWCFATSRKCSNFTYSMFIAPSKKCEIKRNAQYNAAIRVMSHGDRKPPSPQAMYEVLNEWAMGGNGHQWGTVSQRAELVEGAFKTDRGGVPYGGGSVPGGARPPPTQPLVTKYETESPPQNGFTPGANFTAP